MHLTQNTVKAFKRPLEYWKRLTQPYTFVVQIMNNNYMKVIKAFKYEYKPYAMAHLEIC